MEPKIECAYDELMDPRTLKPYPKNPNVHPSAQMELLARLIEHHGWRIPITISKLSGRVIRGHGRLAAALELGLNVVMVWYGE